MPKDSDADERMTNLADRLESSDPGTDVNAESGPRTGRRLGMGLHRITSTPNIAPGQRDHQGAVSGPVTSSTEGPFEPLGAGTVPRAVETSIWDWDAPFDGAAEPSFYFYEPQGELIQEQRERRPAIPDYTIPHPVAGSRSHHQLSTSGAPGSNERSNFARRDPPSSTLSAPVGTKRKSTSDREARSLGKQPEQRRASRVMSDTGDELDSPGEMPPGYGIRSQISPIPRTRSGTSTTDARPAPSSATVEGTWQQGATGGGPGRAAPDPSGSVSLSPRKVFPIQIGDKLFRLSGASISSDAPSYFSQFFEEQLRENDNPDNVRTLYIDRDPRTFEDISLHLQGYHIQPRDGPHFVKLFADAQFFSLPKLTAQLFSSTIYIRIGDSEFQIPRDLFSSPGDSPNYFSLGFAIFFTSPSEGFPGLAHRTLLRPPSILPPSVPNRSARTFADILHFLKGYPVEIRSEEHRQELLRDARYFHLKGLEQRLIPHEISYNLARKRSEIILRLEDIRQSGVSFVADAAPGAAAAGPAASDDTSPASSTASSGTPSGPGWVFYQRPYVDSEAHSLIVETSGEEGTFLSIAPGSATATAAAAAAGRAPARLGRATFHRQTVTRITSLFSLIANKMNLPVTQPLGLMLVERGAGVASLPVSPGNTGLSGDRVKVRIGADADVTVDGKPWTVGEERDEEDEDEDEDEEGEEGAGREDDEGRGEDTEMSGGSSGVGGRVRKRKRSRAAAEEGEEWIVRKAQWRLRVQPVSGGGGGGRAASSGMEVILGAVKIEAFSGERRRNVLRGFLS